MCPWDTDDPPACIKHYNGTHKSRTVRVTLPKFVPGLRFVVISLVYNIYKFYNIWFRQT